MQASFHAKYLEKAMNLLLISTNLLELLKLNNFVFNFHSIKKTKSYKKNKNSKN